MKFLIILFFLVGCIFFLVGKASAAAFVVANTNDSGAGSLREAVNNANSTAQIDEIVFDSTVFGSARTITLSSGEIIVTQPLKILGPGTNLLRISGNMNSRIFFLRNTAVVTLSNLTVNNGKAPVFGQTGFNNYAGGIYIEGGQLYLSQVTLSDCRAEQAGGIYNRQGILHIVNSTISNNQATGGRQDGSYGGGINNDGTLIIANSSIIGNVAQGGTGTSSSFAGSGVGGGIYVYAGNATITNSTIANNSATGGNAPTGFGFGGNGSAAGISISGSSTTIANTLIYNNQAIAGSSDTPSRAGISAGGGITNLTTLELNNVTVSTNSVSSTNQGGGISGGGGIWNSCSGCLTLTNSTVVNNTANNLPGGGAYAYYSFRLRNTIIANNNSPFGPDINNGATSLGNNLIGNGTTSGLINGVNNDRVGTATAPLDPMLAPLANNGGATQTHIPLEGSPAINNGNNCVLQSAANGGCLTNHLITDQRGFVRLNPPGGTIDIGAVEYGSSAFTFTASAAPDLQSSSDTGISNTDNLTNSVAPTFDVSGVPSQATVELLRNGILVASAYSANGGTVSLSDAPGSDGTFIYTSRVTVAGAMSAVSMPLSIIVETVRPTVTVNQAPNQLDPTDIQPIVFIAEFSEPVFGLNASAISLVGSTANTSAANISISSIGSDGRRYLITISNITSTGQIRVSLPAGGAFDAAGNFNVASTSIDNTVNFNLLIEVTVSGRITRSSGVIRSAAIITLTDNQTGAVYISRTNPFGYYRFNQVVTYQQTGRTFTIDIRHKSFSLIGQSVFINNNRSDVNINVP